MRIAIILILSLMCLSCEKKEEKNLQVNNDITILRFGHNMPENSAQHRAALRFSRIISEKTKGQLKVNVFPDQQLGNDREMVAMAKKGELDFILPPTAKLSHLIPEMQILDLPYLFSNHKTLYKALDGDLGKRLLSRVTAYGFTGLSFWTSGFKQITTNQPIEKIKDFSNFRFRIMESNLLKEQFNSWGASVIVIDFLKIYDALKNNIVDGQENPLSSIASRKFYEVQNTLILSNHGYLTYLFSVSNKLFDKLEPNYQRVIREAAVEILDYQRTESEKGQQLALNEIKKSNINIVKFNHSIESFLKEKSKSLIEKFRFKFGTALVESALQYQNEDKKFSKNELIIALDADMQGNSALSGLSIKRGIQLAIDEINQSGGLLGKKVSLIVRDNSMIPARGINNLKYFSKIPNLLAVFGGISSPVVLNELKYIHQNKILFLAPWAAATPITSNGYNPNYVFRISIRDEYAAPFLLKEAMKVSDNIGLMLVNNPWGRGNYKNLLKSASSMANINFSIEWFDWGEKEFKYKVSRLKNKNANVIIFVGNSIEGAKFVKALAKLNYLPKIISHWGITGSNFSELAGESLNKIDLKVLQTYSFINKNSLPVKNILKQYNKKYFTHKPSDIVAPVGTAHAYDLMKLLAVAVKKSKSIDMAVIRDELEKIKTYNGILKKYDPPFTPKRHDALFSTDFIFARYKNNALVPGD